MSESPIDLDALAAWMDTQSLGRGPIENVERLGGGTQNILLRFERSGTAYVLRHPPPHKRRNSDETMRREARVLAALAHTDVPHPRFIAGCPDVDVLGSAFYLMTPVDGFNPTVGLPEPHASDREMRRAMGPAMAEPIALLGNVDHRAVGLGDFGKPDGWLERQVPRWRAQLDGYAEHEGYDGPDIPGVDDVGSWLDAHRPATWHVGIIHGDYHLANVLISPTGPEVAAIVDWELATLGDPLLDLGHVLSLWPEPGGGGFGGLGDLPAASAVIDRYADLTDRSLDDVDWYRVLACYRLGIILEGTNARAADGKAPRDVGDLLHATTVDLFERALRLINA